MKANGNGYKGLNLSFSFNIFIVERRANTNIIITIKLDPFTLLKNTFSENPKLLPKKLMHLFHH